MGVVMRMSEFFLDPPLVHAVLLTNFSVFADVCQLFILLRFCADIQIKISALWVLVNGCSDLRFCTKEDQCEQSIRFCETHALLYFHAILELQ